MNQLHTKHLISAFYVCAESLEYWSSQMHCDSALHTGSVADGGQTEFTKCRGAGGEDVYDVRYES